jgi:hypothetical protein
MSLPPRASAGCHVSTCCYAHVQGQGREEEEAAEGGQDPGGEGKETVLRGENAEVSLYLSCFFLLTAEA